VYIKISLALAFFFFTVSSNAMTHESFEKECSQETLVFNKKGEQVGAKIGGYCSGYLLGALEILSESSHNVCIDDNFDKSPNYLLSVYHSYVKEKGTDKNLQVTLLLAYERAFGC
jgi:hypothetical protein